MAVRRKKQQVTAKLKEIAPPGETFQACVHCETGPSPWLNALFDEVPLLGLIIALTRKFYFLTETSQHVVLNSANRFTNRPGDAVGSWPLRDFPVTRVKRGRVWSSFYVQLPGAPKPVRLNVHRYWRSGMAALLAAVGTPPSPPPSPAEGPQVSPPHGAGRRTAAAGSAASAPTT